MKLKFIKNKESDFSIKIIEGSKSKAFDYIYFINNTYKDRLLEDPIFEGEFLETEISRINEMIKDLKNTIIPRRKVRKP